MNSNLTVGLLVRPTRAEGAQIAASSLGISMAALADGWTPMRVIAEQTAVAIRR